MKYLLETFRNIINSYAKSFSSASHLACLLCVLHFFLNQLLRLAFINYLYLRKESTPTVYLHRNLNHCLRDLNSYVEDDLWKLQNTSQIDKNFCTALAERCLKVLVRRYLEAALICSCKLNLSQVFFCKNLVTMFHFLLKALFTSSSLSFVKLLFNLLDRFLCTFFFVVLNSYKIRHCVKKELCQ